MVSVSLPYWYEQGYPSEQAYRDAMNPGAAAAKAAADAAAKAAADAAADAAAKAAKEAAANAPPPQPGDVGYVPPPPPKLSERFADVIQQQEQTAGLRPRPAGPSGFGLGPGTQVAPQAQQVQSSELFSYNTPRLGNVNTQLYTAPESNLNVTVPTATTGAQVQAQQINTLPDAQAAIGQLSNQALVNMSQTQGQVTTESIATAVTQELDVRGTVKYQLGELYSSIEAGEELPPWASGPIRAVSSIMQSRGLGSSSMASAALITALQETAIPIAQQDANKYSNIQIQNLNSQQTATMANAAVYATMDRANLDSRMNALVNNSRAFLQIDTQNLTNEQQSGTIDYQTQANKLFTDTAAENAARNFNATSQNQVNQFYETLGATVEQNNVNRVQAQQQFNVDEANAMKQFDASINDLRDRTYTQNQLAINQSNAVWRRSVNTANTANINEAQRSNAQALLGLSADAQNRMWQQYRDEANFLMTQTENRAARAHDAAKLSTQINANMASYNQSVKDSFWSGLGNAVVNIL